MKGKKPSYLKVVSMRPGPEHLKEAVDYLSHESERISLLLSDIENDDGSIPEDKRERWSALKGKLDQTVFIQGMLVQSIILDESLGGEKDE